MTTSFTLAQGDLLFVDQSFLFVSLGEKNNGCLFFVEKSELFLTPWVKKSWCQIRDRFGLKWIRTLGFLLGTEGAQN